MIETMISLGEFRFSINTAAYQNLKRTAEYSWPSQARFGRKPAVQFTGPGSETVTLDGVIYPHFRGGLGQVDNMREMAAEGIPLLMGDGMGSYWGKWVITRIEETQSYFLAGGIPRKIEFNIEVKAYGEDV
ncbi:MAG: phage tail protein [Magnetococcales bacterium]|nr:phage tail protein [Magnetococcales bacterium]